ncbi:MAG: hypothetical protein SGPRY_006135 [Prymnesium sp.]
MRELPMAAASPPNQAERPRLLLLSAYPIATRLYPNKSAKLLPPAPLPAMSETFRGGASPRKQRRRREQSRKTLPTSSSEGTLFAAAFAKVPPRERPEVAIGVEVRRR